MLGVRHRAASLLFIALVTMLAASGFSRLQIDTDFSSLIAADDPDRLVYDRVSNEFGSDNRSLIYIRDAQLWTPGKLAVVEQMHDALVELDFVERVEDIYTLRSIRGSEQQIESRLLLAEAPQQQSEATLAYENALYNSLIVGNFLSHDGGATAVVVMVRDSNGEPGYDHRVNSALQQVIDSVGDEFEEIFQVGPPRINAEMKDSLFDDMVLLAPLSALLLVVTIVVLVRSTFAAVIPVVTSMLSIFWAFGIMGWLNVPINILSAMIPSLIIVIGSTEDTHMISAYFHSLVENEKQADRRSMAVKMMVRHMGVPLLLAILTTCMGFASNIFSTIGLIQDFAIASTVAVLANGVITLLLVPMLLDVIGPKDVPGGNGRSWGGQIPQVMVKLFGITHQHYSRFVLIFTALLCAFFVYQATKLSVTNDPLSYFRHDRQLIQDVNRVQQDMSGVKVFFVALESRDERAFIEPRNLRRLVEIQEFIQNQGVFGSTISLADQLALVNREFHGGDLAQQRIPDSRELIAQYLLFYHRNDLKSYVSHDFSRANIVVRHNVTDSATLNQSVTELARVASEIAGGDIKAYVVGENLMINRSAETLMVAQVKSLGILLLVIFLVMSAMFTSFRGGVIALIPGLIPIILMFGVMGLFDIPLNPGTAMVAVIAIGIAVDGTIHLFSRYNELCRSTADYTEAVKTTVEMEAMPVVTTSLALALGFGVLLFSNFTLVAQFGALSAATMLFSIFANLLITPLIMTRVRVVGLHQILALSASRDVLEKSPLFKGMSEYQVRKAILISETHEFAQDEMLLTQGGFGRSMYLILSGSAEVVHNEDGGEKRVALLGPGQVFGEIGFVRETTRTAGVRALSEVRVLRFDFERIRKDLRYFPNIVAAMNFNISCILGERLGDLMDTSAHHTDDDS